MWDYEKLKGLPAEGPYPKQFANKNRQTYSEGFVIKFRTKEETWVGNFQSGGLTSYDEVFSHSNLAVIISGGQVYVINVITKEMLNCFGAAITSGLLISEKEILILVEMFGLIALKEGRILWQYEIDNCDGIREVKYSGNTIAAEFCLVPDDSWVSFKLNIDTGKLIELTPI